MESTKYYVIEVEYVGCNDTVADPMAHRVEICTEIPRTNMSGEPRADGWLGTSNDWSRHARGCYETLEAAREH